MDNTIQHGPVIHCRVVRPGLEIVPIPIGSGRHLGRVGSDHVKGITVHRGEEVPGGQPRFPSRQRCPHIQDHVTFLQGKIPAEKKGLELRNQSVAGRADESVLIEKEVNGVFACHSGLLEGERVG